jgi:hypothetical protein
MSRLYSFASSKFANRYDISFTIPDGVQFQPYDEDLSFRLPTNANQVDPANPSLSINYIRVVSISGLPFG